MASLFDGIGGFPLIWNELGGETKWASEIEPFPIAVTKYHFGEEKRWQTDSVGQAAAEAGSQDKKTGVNI